MARSLNDIATEMRMIANMVGGNHYTNTETEQKLNELADELSDITYEVTDKVDTISNAVKDIAGIYDNGLYLYRKQKAMLY